MPDSDSRVQQSLQIPPRIHANVDNTALPREEVGDPQDHGLNAAMSHRPVQEHKPHRVPRPTRPTQITHRAPGNFRSVENNRCCGEKRLASSRNTNRLAIPVSSTPLMAKVRPSSP